MKIINYIKCLFGFHKRYIDDLGGCFFESCRRCNWVGKIKDIFKE